MTICIVITVSLFHWSHAVLLNSFSANERLQRLRLLRLSRTEQSTDVTARERIITGLLRRRETAESSGESSGENSGAGGVSYLNWQGYLLTGLLTLTFHVVLLPAWCNGKRQLVSFKLYLLSFILIIVISCFLLFVYDCSTRNLI